MDKRESRIIALKILYSFDILRDFSLNNLDALIKLIGGKKKESKYAINLISGIAENKERLDKLISRFSKNWKISRMSTIDRNVLRLGIYEHLYCEHVPFKVVIDEAIEIAKEYGDSNSGSFINGILDSLISEKRESEKK